MTGQSDDYDSPWKRILETYFHDFVTFFFPVVAEGVDWSKGYSFLDKELQQVVRDAELGRRLADKLVQVWRKDGNEAWVLIGTCRSTRSGGIGLCQTYVCVQLSHP